MATGKTLEAIRCPRCSFASKRITSVEEHVRSVHGIAPQELWDLTNGGPVKCGCGCGSTTTWINFKLGYSKLLKGHNARIYAVYDEETVAKIAATRGSNWRGRPSWSKGLTKETDERVAARGVATSLGRKKAFEEGRLRAWSKDLTKETDERVAAASAQLKDGYASGKYVPWAQGLTKETDERVANMAVSVSLAHKTVALRKRLDELKRLNDDEIRSRIEVEGSTLRLISSEGYVNDATPNVYVECVKCGTRTYSTMRQLQHHRCYTCDPAGSAAQCSIASFVESLGVVVEKNNRRIIAGDRRHAELDIYVPSHAFAIEYNGLYWHCALHKTDTYHQSKTDNAANVGIRLLHIYEDEWRDRGDVVRSLIKHRLGLSTVRVGARECELRTLDVEERRRFFEENHVDGDTNAKMSIGLFAPDGSLVSALSLRVPFHAKHAAGALEVARMANKKDTVVPGGLSRLTKAAAAESKKLGYHSLMTYVDTRLGSNHSSWEKAGWKLTGETVPRFWWTDFHHRFNRFKYRADKVRDMSEAEVAEEAGVVRIFGCKNLTLVMKT